MGAVGRSVADKPAAPTRASTCVSKTHLCPVSEHAAEIGWWKMARDAARVQEYTCPACDDDQYELCTLGGLWFIRRDGAYETIRDTRDEAERLWSLLVAGAAR